MFCKLSIPHTASPRPALRTRASDIVEIVRHVEGRKMMYNEPRGFLSSGHSGEGEKKHSKREKKSIPKNVRSKIFIKLFGFWKLLDNVLSKVFGASCANKQRFLTLRSPARPPIERCFWSRRKRKTTEILVLIGDQNAFEALLSRSW